jgi:general secretion pathway protein D
MVSESRSIGRNILYASGLAMVLTIGGYQAEEVDPISITVAKAPQTPSPGKANSFTCEDGHEFRLRDLEVDVLRVANQDVSQLLQVLATIGYETVEIPSKAPVSIYSGGRQNTSPYPGQRSGQYPGQNTGQFQNQVPGQYQRQNTGSFPGQNSSQFSRQFNNQASAQTAVLQSAGKKYTCDMLPVIVMPPRVGDSRLGFDSSDFLGLAGGSSAGSSGSSFSGGSRGGYGSNTSGGVRGDISPALHNIDKPHSGEMDELLVFYHPEQEREFRELQILVRDRLDVPAAQIYIEGLVLEVSEEGIRGLGIRYDRTDPQGNLDVGVGVLEAAPVSTGGAQVFNLVRDNLLSTTGAPDQRLLQIQALVSNGTAQILSRPSVLTLNNRQATIQIIDIVQFPIQEATIGRSGDIVQSAFTFEAVRPGITLNLRPRVSADREFVTMEIDVTVEALVSANNGDVRNEQGQVIATKPGSSTRRVQTFARIPDRTPIIIGGLISLDNEDVNNKIPLLSNIPFVGKLFGANRKSVGKREVIIVLTPYLVGEDTASADVSKPKDTSMFDISDTTLFLDSYRVRAEDVYDLQFLVGSPEFIERKHKSEQVRDHNPDLASQAPFNQFLNGNIPGGDKFLNRMMYDLVRRRDFGADINYEQLIVLRKTSSGNTEVALMSNLIEEVESSRNKALIMVFGEDPQGGVNQTADIQVVELPRNKSWEELLWDLSYGSADGIERSAVIVRNKADLARLVDATISAAVLERNGGHDKLTVGRFETGTLFSIPSFDTGRFYVVDEKVARVFTDVQHYYRATVRALEQTYRDMDRAIAEGALEQ